MRTSTKAAPRSILSRAGLAGFLFFLIKGLLWLSIPAWLYATR